MKPKEVPKLEKLCKEQFVLFAQQGGRMGCYLSYQRGENNCPYFKPDIVSHVPWTIYECIKTEKD